MRRAVLAYAIAALLGIVGSWVWPWGFALPPAAEEAA